MTGLVAVASVKGSPGVTTAVVGLAAAWPTGRSGVPAVVVEADPSGGDLLGWYGLGVQPGLVTWAAQARTGRATISGHVQHLPGGVPVVAGPVEAAAARGAVEVVGQSGSVRAAADSVLLLADVGRLDPVSAAVTGTADLLVMVVRPTPVELARVAGREAELTAAGRRDCVLLLAGEPAWPAARVEEAVGIPVLGVLPYDARGAGLVAGVRGGRRAAAHSALAHSCTQIAEALAGRLAARPVPLPPAPGWDAGALASSPVAGGWVPAGSAGRGGERS